MKTLVSLTKLHASLLTQQVSNFGVALCSWLLVLKFQAMYLHSKIWELLGILFPCHGQYRNKSSIKRWHFFENIELNWFSQKIKPIQKHKPFICVFLFYAALVVLYEIYSHWLESLKHHSKQICFSIINVTSSHWNAWDKLHEEFPELNCDIVVYLTHTVFTYLIFIRYDKFCYSLVKKIFQPLHN